MSLNNDLAVKLYQSISAGDEVRVFKHWHASSIAECPRSHYFKRLGVAGLRKPSGAKILRWGAGHHLELSIRPHVEKVWGKTVSNRRLTSELLDLTGEFDNLSVKDKRLIEIKSVHDLAFIERDGVTTLKNEVKTDGPRRKFIQQLEPYLGHQLQNHAYAMLLAEEGIKVTGIDYVYLSLSGRVVVYRTDVQEKYLANVKARLAALNEAWKTKTPPPCICKPEHPLYDSVMQWCDYKTDAGCCDLELMEVDNAQK